MVFYIVIYAFTDDDGCDWEVRQYPAGYIVLEPVHEEEII